MSDTAPPAPAETPAPPADPPPAGPADVAVIDRDDPHYVLQPGDPGWAPAARIAHPTGVVLTREHLGYLGGSDATLNVAGEVPLAVPPPAPPMPTTPVSYNRPSTISPSSARALLGKMIGDFSSWISDLPHETFGEQAVVVQFFRDLKARRMAQGTAAELGRTVEPDQVDNAAAAAPAEYFELRHLAQQLLVVVGILEASHAVLSDEDQAKVESIKGEFAKYADAPTSPDALVQDPSNDNTPPAEADHAAEPTPPAEPPPIAA